MGEVMRPLLGNSRGQHRGYCAEASMATTVVTSVRLTKEDVVADNQHTDSNGGPPESEVIDLGEGVELTLGQGAGTQESKRFIYN